MSAPTHYFLRFLKFIILVYGLLILLSTPVIAQGDAITVRGTVYDPVNRGSIPNLMVVNKRTQQGYFGYNTGFFEINILKNDTLLIAATGFTTLKISFRDSADKGTFDVRIPLHQLTVQLKPVEIFSRRDLEEIQKDIEKLGYDPKDDMPEGIDMISSPITALYMAFSKRERSKRLVAEMRNNDKRRELLKELFRKYADHDIIRLTDEEFDNFIDFCNVSEAFLKNSTQYEFIMFVKKRYELYRMTR